MNERDGNDKRRDARARLWRTGALVFWAVMMMWLVRYEAFPEVFTRSIDGYHSLMSQDMLVMDSWMRILFKGAPLGYSHTSMEVDETNPARYHTINNRVHLNLKIMGEMQRIRVDSTIMLNLMEQLQSFQFTLTSPGASMNVRAQRLNERYFDVMVRTGASRQLTKVEIPPDVVLYSPMTEVALKQLKPGQEMSMRTLDPSTMTTASVLVRALRKETLTVGGAEIETTALALEYRGMTILGWLDGDGQMVRQDTPFGWTMERCTVDEAFAALEASGQAEDMLTGLAVTSRGALREPRGTQEVKLKLSGVAFEEGELTTGRQIVESSSGQETILVVKAGRIPSVAVREAPRWLHTGAEAPEEFRPHLGSSSSVQADHPDMVARAKSIVGSKTDPLEKATLLYEWVYAKVEKKMTVSLPSALDVLRTMKGDCNEHTYLTVALARAAGLPAKIKVGLAYHQGAFYYHAWPAVYIGEWLEMDPTWGQVAVDATHIALVEGDLAEQVKLVKVMGQLKIDVIREGPER